MLVKSLLLTSVPVTASAAYHYQCYILKHKSMPIGWIMMFITETRDIPAETGAGAWSAVGSIRGRYRRRLSRERHWWYGYATSSVFDILNVFDSHNSPVTARLNWRGKFGQALADGDLLASCLNGTGKISLGQLKRSSCINSVTQHSTISSPHMPTPPNLALWDYSSRSITISG